MIITTRSERRALEADNRKQPVELRRVPESQWPATYRPRGLKEVWRSRDFLLQVFDERGDIERLSFCRTAVNGRSDWVDGISWDDLQSLKRQCGRGDRDAVEVFPADIDIVNVANMRHLWVMPSPLEFKWRGR